MIRSLDRDPELQRSFRSWVASRNRFNSQLRQRESTARDLGWQRHYFQGRSLNGDRYEEHETRLRLRDFVEEPEPRDRQPDA